MFLSSIVVVGSVTAATSNKPTISGYRVLPASLNYLGGSVTASATVNNATRCIFTSSPAVAGLYKNMACSSGRVSYVAKFPENTSTKNIVYTFKLIVTGKKGDGNVTAPLKTVTVVAVPKPVINSFTTSNSELSSVGGAISLTGVVNNEVTCSISANPAIEGTSSNPVPCNTGSAIASVVMPENTSATDITYTFILTVKGYADSVSKTLQVTVDSNPPATTTTTTPPPTTTVPPTVGNTVKVGSEPDAFVLAGGNLWVASCSGNSVTEINESSEQVEQVLNNTSYDFDCPDALAFSNGYILVANKLNSSITEINASTGADIAVLTGSQISNPVSLVSVTGGYVWIGSSYIGNPTAYIPSLSKLDVVQRNIVKTVTDTNSSRYLITDPQSMAFDGADIWVVDNNGNSVYEFNAADGVYIRTLFLGTVGGVSAISYHSGYIWVNGFNSSKVGEFNATSGAEIRVINIVTPGALIFNGSNIFIVSEYPVDTLREYTIAGSLVRTIAKSNADIGHGINAILLDGNNIWTANYSAGTVSKYPI